MVPVLPNTPVYRAYYFLKVDIRADVPIVVDAMIMSDRTPTTEVGKYRYVILCETESSLSWEDAHCKLADLLSKKENPYYPFYFRFGV